MDYLMSACGVSRMDEVYNESVYLHVFTCDKGGGTWTYKSMETGGCCKKTSWKRK